MTAHLVFCSLLSGVNKYIVPKTFNLFSIIIWSAAKSLQFFHSLAHLFCQNQKKTYLCAQFNLKVRGTESYDY